MDDLRVESYEMQEVAAKKQSISKRVAVAGCTLALTLGIFGLTACTDREEEYYVVGGAGAWFNSTLEHEEE